MKKIVIIGNSAAGIAAAEAIREKDKASQLSIVSEENTVAYQRPKLLSLLEGKMREGEIILRSADFYRNNNIELFLDRKVTGISVNRRKLHFKDGEPMDFDALLIAAGRKVAVPDIKGVQKEGVVVFSCLESMRFIQDNLPIAHTVIIVAGGAAAEPLARFIAGKKIEVKFFGDLPSPPEGVEVINDNPLLEILGEGEVRAVRLASQKVIGASLVIYTGPYEPRIDFLRDTDIKIDKGILVDSALRTNIPYIFAAGDVCAFADKEKTCGWEAAAAEGRVAGDTLCQT